MSEVDLGVARDLPSISFILLHVVLAIEDFWNYAQTEQINIGLIKLSDVSLSQVRLDYIGLDWVVPERTEKFQSFKRKAAVAKFGFSFIE